MQAGMGGRLMIGDDEPVYYFADYNGLFFQYGPFHCSDPPPFRNPMIGVSIGKSKKISAFLIQLEEDCYGILIRGILSEGAREIWLLGSDELGTIDNSMGKRIILLPPLVCKISLDYPHFRPDYLEEFKLKVRSAMINAGVDQSAIDKFDEMVDETIKSMLALPPCGSEEMKRVKSSLWYR